MRAVLLYTAAIGFMSGVLARSFSYTDVFFALTVLLVGFTLIVVARVRGASERAAVVLLAVLALSFSIGSLRMSYEEYRDVKFTTGVPHGEEVEVLGVVAHEPDLRERTVHVVVETETIVSEGSSEEVETRILVVLDRFTDIAYGDVVHVRGVIEAPEPFDTDLGRTFYYPEYLAVRDLFHTMSFAEVEVVGRGEGNVIVAGLLMFKHAFMERIEALMPEPQSGLAEGILLGVKRALGEDLEAAFRATGVIHIVVLSGYNITIVSEAIMRLLSAFFAPRTRFVLGACAIVGFAVLVGLSATVVRASLMALLVLVARATGRIYAVVRALVFSGFLMVLINPRLLAFDPGFQLSFLATLGLILLAPIIEERLSLVPTRLQIREFLTATVATQMFVLPLLLFSMGELSLVAVPVNILVLVAVPFSMLFTFIAGVVGFVSAALALPFSYVAYALLSYIIAVVEKFAALPFASVTVPSFPFWVVVVAYVFLGVMVWMFAQKPVRRGVVP